MLIFLGMNLRKRANNKLPPKNSLTSSKLMKKKMLMSFFYSNGMLKWIGVEEEALEIEYRRKQSQEIQQIKKSKQNRVVVSKN